MAAVQSLRTMPFPSQPSKSLQWDGFRPNNELGAVMAADWGMTAPWIIGILERIWKRHPST